MFHLFLIKCTNLAISVHCAPLEKKCLTPLTFDNRPLVHLWMYLVKIDCPQPAYHLPAKGLLSILLFVLHKHRFVLEIVSRLVLTIFFNLQILKKLKKFWKKHVLFEKKIGPNFFFKIVWSKKNFLKPSPTQTNSI